MRLTIAAMVATASLLLAVAPNPASAVPDADPTVDQIYQAAKTGHLDKAQQLMDQVLHDHPKSGKAHFVQAELYARQGKPTLARSQLAQAEQLDPGLTHESARSVRELKSVLGLPSQAASPAEAPSTAPDPATHLTTYRIPLAHQWGTLVAAVFINNAIKLGFTVDSGAADVSIPADVFSTLVRAATISRSDITGSQNYLNASGESHESRTFIIRSLKLADVEVLDVEASVAPARAPLLLGQSFLKRFKHWSIDNTSQELILQR